MAIKRFLLLIAVGLLAIGGTGPQALAQNADGAPAQAAPPPAEVYVFRPMGGRLATREMDKIAAKLGQYGLKTSVLNYTNWIGPARRAASQYRKEDRKSPIIIIGHSAGGDSAIRFASLLNRSRVPVDLIITIDPTRLPRKVPRNVERFINVYASDHSLGGGTPEPARDFTGHFTSVDLHDYVVLHRYLPEIPSLQNAVIDKIVSVARAPETPPGTGKPVEYMIPRDQPVILWDTAARVQVNAGETGAMLADQFGVPAWAVGVMNQIDPSRPLAAAQMLTVPYNVAGAQPLQ